MADTIQPTADDIRNSNENVLYSSSSPGAFVHYNSKGSRQQSSNADELYLNTPTSDMMINGPSRTVIVSATQNKSTSSREEVDVNWLEYRAPAELLHCTPGTSSEIESILEASIERLRERLIEKDRLYEAHFQENEYRALKISILHQEDQTLEAGHSFPAATEMPRDKGKGKESSQDFSKYGKSGINPFSPESYIHGMEGNWGRLNSSASDIAATSSRDSGYFSGSNDIPSTKPKFGMVFGFRGLFKRSKMSTVKLKTSDDGPSTVRECVSCLEDFDSKLVVTLICHAYCKTCFKTLIDTAMVSETYWPPKCCLNEIPKDIIVTILDPKAQIRYQELVVERSIPAGDRIYCSKTSCGAWIPEKNIEKAISCAACTLCRQKTCLTCRGEYHSTGECPTDTNLQATVQLATDSGWKRCYSCKAFVEHNQGCIHMTCKCKAQFCYVCGARWHTCNCSDAMLVTVRQAADSARNARQAGEREADARRRAIQAANLAAQAQADELAEILSAIEAFETEELIRLEEEEEVRRITALAARERREEEGIESVSKRYYELSMELEFLHDLQKLAMIDRYEAQGQITADSFKKVIARRMCNDSTELRIAEAEMQARISDSRFQFDSKMAKWLTQERNIEDDYVKRLQDYWSGYPEGEMKVMEMRDKIQELHIDEYRKRVAEGRVQHQAIVRAGSEEIVRIKSKQAAAMMAIEEKQKKREQEAHREILADYKWLEAVAAERLDMLRFMEQDEYAQIYSE